LIDNPLHLQKHKGTYKDDMLLCLCNLIKYTDEVLVFKYRLFSNVSKAKNCELLFELAMIKMRYRKVETAKYRQIQETNALFTVLLDDQCMVN
jgi:hypothetical protein